MSDIELLHSFMQCASVSANDTENLRKIVHALIQDHNFLQDYLSVSHLLPPRPPDIVLRPGAEEVERRRETSQFDLACAKIIDEGVEFADANLLLCVLQDPEAIIDIHLTVTENTPDYWRAALAKNGAALAQKNGKHPQLSQLTETRDVSS